jgi:hypothetical protein
MVAAALRRWSKINLLKLLSLPVGAFLVSLFVVGFDWPVRYFANLHSWENVRAWPPDTPLTATIWRAAGALHVSNTAALAVCSGVVLVFIVGVWRWRTSLGVLGLALATNLFVTPYAFGHHYVLLVPAFLFVAARNRWLAVIAWMTTWTPLLRIIFGLNVGWIDVIYPTVLLVATWLMWAREPRGAAAL